MSPDISMCQNKDCPSHKACYRFNATPKPHSQSYAGFVVYEGKKKCEYYIKMEEPCQK